MKLGQKRKAAGLDLYEALLAVMSGLNFGEQLAVGRALVEGVAWDELRPWQRELFRTAEERIRDE